MLGVESIGPHVPPGSVHWTSSSTAAIASYFVVSVSMVLLNKQLLIQAADVSAVVITAQQIFYSTLFFLPVMLWAQKNASSNVVVGRSRETQLQLLRTTVLPLSLAHVCMLLLNTISLRRTSTLVLYHITRSLSPLFGLLLTWFVSGAGARTPSEMEVFGCIVLVAGFLLGHLQDMLVSDFFAGITHWLHVESVTATVGLLSSFFVALHALLLKRALNRAVGDRWALFFWSSLVSFVMLFLYAVISREDGNAARNRNTAAAPRPFSLFSLIYNVIVPVGGIFSTLFTAIMGVLLQICIAWVVNVSSALTFTVVGLTKAATQAILGPIVLGDRVGFLGWLSFLVSLAGSVLYSFGDALLALPSTGLSVWLSKLQSEADQRKRKRDAKLGKL